MAASKLDLLLQIAQGLVRTHTNIAESYHDWLTCCFACASFGEQGREAAHLISSQSSKYKREDTDTQFNACLKSVHDCDNLSPLLSLSKQQGFILRDFLASQVGRGSARGRAGRSSSESGEQMPLDFPQVLPAPAAEALRLVDDESSAFAVLQAFCVAAGSILPRCGFMYAGRTMHLNLYTCCVAPPASGKSVLSVCRAYLQDVHDRKRRKSDRLMQDYRDLCKRTPAADRDQLLPPPLLTHFLPADTSVSALMKTIHDNGGGGVIWESELDTLTRNFRSDYGNFSDGLRNAWGGEQISYNRKTSRELLEIADPHFCVSVSCTPAQIRKFFGSAENGLFSRFMFCRLPTVLEWRSQWQVTESAPISGGIAHFLAELEEAAAAAPCMVRFSEAQQRAHDAYFERLQFAWYGLCGAEMLPIVRRLGVCWGRIASILTLVQMWDDQRWGAHDVPALDDACQAAYSIIERAASDAAEVLLTLPQEEGEKGGRREAERLRIYANLAPEFTLADLPPEMSKSARYRLLSLWINAGQITKDGSKYHKISQ